MRRNFVCVRVTQMNGVDISRFDFDFDCTWAGFFVDADLNVYSRYGGRDHNEPEDRLSTPSFLQTMGAVLAAHASRKSHNAADLSMLHPAPKKRARPEDIPLLKQNHQGCVHCHQVREYQLLQASHDGVFNRDKLFVWPLPENVGLEFDVEHGHRVKTVKRRSLAEQAGVKVGDVISKVDDVWIRSELDFRWALKRTAKESAKLVVSRSSDDEKQSSEEAQSVVIELPLTGDWRVHELGWHRSMRSVPLNYGFRGYALTPSQRRSEGFGSNQLAIRITTVRGGGLAKALDLQKKDVVIGVGSQSSYRRYEEFRSDVLTTYKPGDTVKLTVHRDGKRVQLSGKFPDWHTEEVAVP